MDYNKRVRVDLHVHSTASDGSLSPIEILTLADRLNIGAVAITDHDTIAGSKMVLNSDFPGNVEFVTGVEISASFPPSYPGSGSFHILGYGFQVDDEHLNLTLKRLQTARAQRNPRIMERLNILGLELSLEEVSAVAGENGLIGRPHIASVMVKKGLVASIGEAFDRFLGTGKPAYVDKFRVGCSAAIDMIGAAGGIPVIAHPGLLNNMSVKDFEEMVLELKEMGLKGIEAYYPEHSKAQTTQFIETANKFGLLITGGTDFHGAIKPEVQLGLGTGDFSVPYQVYEKLKAHI